MIKFKVILFLMMFLWAVPVKAENVGQACSCFFPAVVQGYSNFKITARPRPVLLRIIPQKPFMVLETFAERYGKTYRFVSLVASSETKTIGEKGVIIEISRWMGSYHPSIVLYQLSLEDIDREYIRLNYNYNGE
ncbi:MAG: hypothetical protein ACE5DQ_02270 [Candidatus Paceibacterota bacterium]